MGPAAGANRPSGGGTELSDYSSFVDDRSADTSGLGASEGMPRSTDNV